MLCLKAEALGHDLYVSRAGVILPMNLSSSIHGFLRKDGRGFRFLNRSSSSRDGSGSSSGLEDTKTHDGRSGREKGGKMRFYRFLLEQDVKQLQKQLHEEIDLHVALARAVEHSTAPLSTLCQLPDKARELLANIAMLEITVTKLEEELVALHCQLSQERNERRLTEYHIRHLSSPPSWFGDSPHLKEQISRPCGRGEMEEWVKDSIVENLWHNPNKLSEEMVRCMRDIFLCLADSSKFSSSECLASPQGHLSRSSRASCSDSSIIPALLCSSSTEWHHGCEVLETDNWFDPYRVHGKVNWTKHTGSYGMAAEVSWMSIGKEQLEYAAGALKNFRLLVEQLAKVNPACMSCNERLAFWINLFNALIMHAYLAYGVPRSDTKLFSLMQKVAYTVGGNSFSAADIEYIILKMKPLAHRPQMALVLALHEFRISEEQRKYSIEKPEPLIMFALSCGMHSSPAVRIFRPENVNEELQNSLRDYIRASVAVSSKGKLLVPKLLYCFAKGTVEDSLLPDWICQFLCPEQAAVVQDCSSHSKQRVPSARSFTVLPFDSRFRYLFLRESITSWSYTLGKWSAPL